jgi:hypothetical protein
MEGQSDSWKQKVHPLFIETARVYRDAVQAFMALGPNPPAEKVSEIDGRYSQELEEVRSRYAQAQYTPTADDPLDIILVDVGPSSWPPSQRELNQAFLEHLYWKRYNEPLWIALQKENAGDLDALPRVFRVAADYERVRFGKGPIKPAKGDPDHAALFELGLDLGLSTLTEEELADCFDAACPCGKIHDPDALKKQRSRKQKALQKARDWLATERAKLPTREWMAAFGMHGLYAKGLPPIGGAPPLVYIGKIGGPALWCVSKTGDVAVLAGPEFASISVLQELPQAFSVTSSKELFAMFFPEDGATKTERC